MCEVGFGASGQPPARFLAAARTAGGVDLVGFRGSWRTLILALAAVSRVVFFHGLTCNSVAGVHLTK